MAACDLHWQVTPRLDATPRHLAVTLTMQTGNRARTQVELPPPWAGVDDFAAHVVDLQAADSQAALEAVPGQPLARRITHRPGETVQVRYRVTSPIADADAATPRSHRDSYRTLLGARWFQAFGHAWVPVLPDWPDTAQARLCVDFDGLPDGSWWIGSHGASQGASASIRFKGSLGLLRHAVYLGGELQSRERKVDGRSVWLAMPPTTPFAVRIDEVSDRVAAMIDAQRRFWRDAGPTMQLVVLQPNHQATGNFGGTAVHQAFAMHAPNDLAVPSPAFDHLVAHEQLHQWIPDRFGPMVYTGQGDEARRYWFSEGFTDFYTHRLLVAAGLWTLDDYARALNAKIDRYRQSPALRASNQRVGLEFFRDPAMGELPYARGEWLALRWHAALRARSHPGMDALMRPLLLPAAQAQRSGPMSKPLVTHRLLAAMRPWLGEAPLHDLTTYIERGEPFGFDERTLGPCFALERSQQPVWQPGFDLAGLAPDKPLAGVDPTGPAHAAGARDGMRVKGFSIHRGDTSKDIVLQLADDTDQVRDVRYRPIGASMREVLSYRPVASAETQSACRAWMGLGPEAQATAGAPSRAHADIALPPADKSGRAGKATRGAKGSKAAKGAGKAGAAKGKSKGGTSSHKAGAKTATKAKSKR